MRHLVNALALLAPLAAAAQDLPGDPPEGACTCEDSNIAVNVRIFEEETRELVDELQRFVTLGCEALSDRRSRALRARFTANCIAALGPDEAAFCVAVGHDTVKVLRVIAFRPDPVEVALTAESTVLVEREDGSTLELDPNLTDFSFFSEFLDNPARPVTRRGMDLDCRLPQRSFVAQGTREDLDVLAASTSETVVVRCRNDGSPYEAVIAVAEDFALDCTDAE